MSEVRTEFKHEMTAGNRGSFPCVSVVIPAYNSSETIGRAIESIASTEYSNLDVIIVDDGSRDDTRDIVSSYLGAYPWLRLVSHEDGCNHGPAATRNRALTLLRGEYVAFLDADDTFLPNRFSECISLFQADPELGFVYSDYRIVPVSGQRAIDMRNCEVVKVPEYGTQVELFMMAIRGGVLPQHGSITVRRSALERVGDFPPLRYIPEKAVWLKFLCSTKAAKCGHEPVSCYYIHDSSICARNEQKASFRFDDIACMLDAYRWMKRNRVDGPMREALARTIAGKFFNYASYVKTIDYRLLRDVLMPPFAVGLTVPSLLRQPRFWKVCVRLALPAKAK